jgi:hypothetical protein
MDWLNLLLGVGSAAAGMPGVGNAIAGLFTGDQGKKDMWGSVIGGLAPGLGMGLMDAFGATDQATANAAKTQADINTLKQLMGESAYTATGAMGPAAQREAAQAANRYIGKSSAEGLQATAAQRNIGSRLLGQGDEMMKAVTAQTQMNLGNNQRMMREAMQNAGASPAALAAGMSNLGQANRESLAGLFAQGTQAQQQALSQAGTAFGQSEATRIADLQNQLEMFKPYAMNLNTAGMGPGALAQMGQYGQMQQQLSMTEDPLAPLKYQAGAGGMYNYMDPARRATLEQQRKLLYGV